MPSIIFVILLIAAVIGIMAGLSKAVISGCVWFVIGLVIKSLFGAAIVSFTGSLGISLDPSTIPAIFAIIGIIASFVNG